MGHAKKQKLKLPVADQPSFFSTRLRKSLKNVKSIPSPREKLTRTIRALRNTLFASYVDHAREVLHPYSKPEYTKDGEGNTKEYTPISSRAVERIVNSIDSLLDVETHSEAEAFMRNVVSTSSGFSISSLGQKKIQVSEQVEKLKFALQLSAVMEKLAKASTASDMKNELKVFETFANSKFTAISNNPYGFDQAVCREIYTALSNAVESYQRTA